MRTFGEGAPLLMLAGAGGRGAGFMPLARRWRAQYRAYMPDPCAPFAPEEAARGLLARMREAGVERFDVLGASLGGCTALAMAALAPERVRSLTLCAAFARLDEETAGRLAALRGRRLALPDDAFDAEWMDLLYGDMPRPREAAACRRTRLRRSWRRRWPLTAGRCCLGFAARCASPSGGKTA